VVPVDRSRGEGLPSNTAEILSLDARDIVEALFFGTGPLAESGNTAHVLEDRVEGWMPGAGLAFIVDAAMPATLALGIENTLPQLATASGGALTAAIVARQPSPGDPLEGEVSVTMVQPDAYPEVVPCAPDTLGCARTFFRNDRITRAHIWIRNAALTSAGLVAHEVGHVYGLAHIGSRQGVRPVFTMVASSGQRLPMLEPATLRAMEAASAARLYVGSHRDQFVAAGLIVPRAVSSARAASRTQVTRVGDERVVTKPFCQ
jgi:hypothetical protein